MKMARTICFVVAIICFVSCSRAPKKVAVTSSRFQTGQVWTFHTPTNELPDATLTIAQVDFDPENGPIVYVSVVGTRDSPWQATNMFYSFTEDALDRSVVALVGTNGQLTGENLRNFQGFYEWGQEGVKAGKLSKCFKITVAEVLENGVKPPRDSAEKPWWHFW
jgi:hypothetical protein